MRSSLLIAVDFDGTIVDDNYPLIGKPKPFAFETLKMLQKDGHRIILWTYRHGASLEEAIKFLENQGILLYAVNRSYPDESLHPTDVSRKIHADLFIDDRNFGGFPGWGEVYQKLNKDGLVPQRRRRGFFGGRR